MRYLKNVYGEKIIAVVIGFFDMILFQHAKNGAKFRAALAARLFSRFCWVEIPVAVFDACSLLIE